MKSRFLIPGGGLGRSKGLGAALVACGVLLAVAPAAPTHPVPPASTRPATEIGATAATLNGVISSHRKNAEYYFEYGTTGYHLRTPQVPVGSRRDPAEVSARVQDLLAQTTYRVRLVLVTGTRETRGDEVTFTTLAPSFAAAGPAPIMGLSLLAVGPPVLGEVVGVAPRVDPVTIKVPGAPIYVPLTGAAGIPVGSLINARRGSVTLRSALPRGGTQTGTFHGGLFEVRQPRSGKGMVELVIRGRPVRCTRTSTASASRTRRRRPRSLWGNVTRGRFRTRGKNSVATVRGTIWYVEDRCSGTLTRVRRGRVSVRDLRRKRTVTVTGGHSYLARAAR